MKKLIMVLAIVLIAIPFAACRVEKTGEDTYSATAPTAEAERAADRAGEQAREAGAEIREGAQQVGTAAAEAGRDAAHATGTALERAGKEAQEHAKPGDQP